LIRFEGGKGKINGKKKEKKEPSTIYWLWNVNDSLNTFLSSQKPEDWFLAGKKRYKIFIEGR